MSDSKTALWLPDDHAPRPPSEALRIDASHTLRKPVLVTTTCGEVQRLVRRMRAEPRDNLVRVSNQKYSGCVAAPVQELSDHKENEDLRFQWERFCGDVVVFHCARWVLDGSGIPVHVASAGGQKNPRV